MSRNEPSKKGACRHSFWPETGRTLSLANQREDVRLMKEANMNAVRMSHYPPDVEFLDLCDEAGLYVLDELGGWQQHYDTPTGRKLIAEMVPRDVNHPSILFWDNGNEGGENQENDDEFAKYDPQQRPGRLRGFRRLGVHRVAHSGMFPCFLGGRFSRLVRRCRSALMTSRRVSDGAMTASTYPRSAAM